MSGNDGHGLTVRQRLERWSIPEPNSGCLLWIGSLNSNGYAQISINGKPRGAHRVSYELHHGPIPSGLTLDHLCRVPSCINPLHLEAVTNKVNVLRGRLGPIQTNAQKTECIHGHPFDEQNTYHRPDRTGRNCRACRPRRRPNVPRATTYRKETKNGSETV